VSGVVEPRRSPRAAAHKGGALVVGADYRGLGVVRSLGRRRIPVWVVRVDEHRLAELSRYARRRFQADDATLVEFLLALSERYGLDGWALVPTRDETAALIARSHRDISERFRVTTPPWEVMQWASDKRLTYRLAERIGVDYPRTQYPRDRNEVETLDYAFPVILKPAIRVGFNRLTAAKAWRVDDRRALLERYDEACLLVDPSLVMIQEIVPGGGEEQFSFAALCSEGRPVASIVARRTRQIPMDFGRASTYVETIDEPEVRDRACALLDAMRFTGLVEVEFKRDPRDGRYKLLDINARVWGWHTVGAPAGVDFPYLLWRQVHGQDLVEVRGRTGVRWVRMTTDVPMALREVARRRLSLRSYVRSLRRPIESAIFARDDPLPGLLELPLLAHVLGGRLLSGTGV
jgi:D-aspartate ligase